MIFEEQINTKRFVNLRYENKNSNFPSIFLLHGAMATRKQFDRLIERLKPLDFNIICYDIYGCGESQANVSRDFGDYTSDSHLGSVFKC